MKTTNLKKKQTLVEKNRGKHPNTWEKHDAFEKTPNAERFRRDHGGCHKSTRMAGECKTAQKQKVPWSHRRWGRLPWGHTAHHQINRVQTVTVRADSFAITEAVFFKTLFARLEEVQQDLNELDAQLRPRTAHWETRVAARCLTQPCVLSFAATRWQFQAETRSESDEEELHRNLRKRSCSWSLVFRKERRWRPDRWRRGQSRTVLPPRLCLHLRQLEHVLSLFLSLHSAGQLAFTARNDPLRRVLLASPCSVWLGRSVGREAGPMQFTRIGLARAGDLVLHAPEIQFCRTSVDWLSLRVSFCLFGCLDRR